MSTCVITQGVVNSDITFRNKKSVDAKGNVKNRLLVFFSLRTPEVFFSVLSTNLGVIEYLKTHKVSVGESLVCQGTLKVSTFRGDNGVRRTNHQILCSSVAIGIKFSALIHSSDKSKEEGLVDETSLISSLGEVGLLPSGLEEEAMVLVNNVLQDFSWQDTSPADKDKLATFGVAVLQGQRLDRELVLKESFDLSKRQITIIVETMNEYVGAPAPFPSSSTQTSGSIITTTSMNAYSDDMRE